MIGTSLFLFIFAKAIQTITLRPIIVKNTFIYIIVILTGILCSSPAYPADKNAEHLSKLKALIDANLAYTREVTNDSIILWEKELEPSLEKQKQYTTLFQLKQMAVCAYATRGDINLAADLAQLMYNKAKSMNHTIGIALSSRAIGDAYLNANMLKEAIDAYEASLQLFNKTEHTEAYAIQLLPRFIITLVQLNKLEKAATYLKQLDVIHDKYPSESTRFYVLTSYACYYLLGTGETAKVEPLLTEAEDINKRLNEIYFQYIINHTAAAYYKAIGDNEQALKLYRTLRAESLIEMYSGKLIKLYQDEASLLAQKGLFDEACRIYQQANQQKDSMNVVSYSRQINHLRTTYQVDQIEIQNQIQQNRLILWTLIAIFFVFILIVLLIIRIKTGNKRLLRSQAQLEKAKRYAESSIKTKSLFLSNMSHEIRTPLNALSGFSSILTEMSIDSQTRLQCNDIIQQNSELLLKLINDVIDLSSLEVGKLTFNFRECDAVIVCRNVVNTVEKVKQTQATIVFDTSLKSLKLLTDDSRLQQVLINLLINATKFTTQGTITLQLSQESETTARFSVTDTGCGIPLEKQSQIFNRFEKLNEGAQGTGLGLSICQLIIEQIGGNIGIDPEYTNGARFVFTHPIRPEIRKEKTK